MEDAVMGVVISIAMMSWFLFGEPAKRRWGENPKKWWGK